MNINLNKDFVKTFRRIAKQDTKAVKYIRTLWLENELDCIDFDDYHGSEKEKKIRLKAKKMKDATLINYYLDFYDGDTSILSKRTIKNLTKKEKELLDIE